MAPAVVEQTGAPHAARQAPAMASAMPHQITELTLGFLLDEGIFPCIAVEIDHLEALKGLVCAGVGVSVMLAWAARRELAAGHLASVRLGPTGLTRSWASSIPASARRRRRCGR